jgi:hypothetical protein
MVKKAKTISGAVIVDKSKANSELVIAISSNSNASQSVSHAAIGDTGNNDNPPNTSVNGTATANMEDGVATTPDMPQAWSDTFLTDVSAGDPEEYAKKMVASTAERLRVRLGLRGPLHAQTPTDDANAGRNANLKKKGVEQ